MLKAVQPQLPFFTPEKRFKPPTTTTAENPAISYFRPPIKFNENPELFLNGLIKDIKKELMPPKIKADMTTQTQAEGKSKIINLELLRRSKEKEYDTTAEIKQESRQSFYESLDATGQLMRELIYGGYKPPKGVGRAQAPLRPRTAPAVPERAKVQQQAEPPKKEQPAEILQAEEAQQGLKQMTQAQEIKQEKAIFTVGDKAKILAETNRSRWTKGLEEKILALQAQGKNQAQITEILKKGAKAETTQTAKAEAAKEAIKEKAGGGVAAKAPRGGRKLITKEELSSFPEFGYEPQPPTGGKILPPVKKSGSTIGKK